MAQTPATNNPVVRIGQSISDTFEQLENTIRERAYSIFENRDPDDGDSVSDWFQAQSEVLSEVDLELTEHKSNFSVEGMLKGFEPNDIEVEIDGQRVTISGEHSQQQSSEEKGVESSRSESIRFMRSLALPSEVNLDEVDAKLHKNGKFKLKLPKATA